ncbi:kinase-like protein [Phaffia rhodozyma]|uniref:mitogen-activated protein kinase kinase n=1 Tax=Phaffia rhodozyma TaxID=264483 RepID=A0A0F7ST14_PHARH|nr:kinase-like protein [Phaffia rhodozyma]
MADLVADTLALSLDSPTDKKAGSSPLPPSSNHSTPPSFSAASSAPNVPTLESTSPRPPAPSGSLAGATSGPRPPPPSMSARRLGMNPNGLPARGPVLGANGPRPGGGPALMPPGLAAKLAAQSAQRQATGGPSLKGPINSSSPVPPSLMNRPGMGQATASAPGGLASRRAAAAAAAAGGGPAGGMGRPPPGGGIGARRFPPGRIPGAGGSGGMPGGMTLNGMGLGPRKDAFSNFGKIVDPSGRLNFASKAVLSADGVDFSSGQSYKINMSELTLQDELGKGQYGTVQKVFHKPTKVVMAMKEIHLELDDSKLKGILMELDILHRAVAPEIVEFYGAFFIESCVYYCMEYMDAGSLDRVYEDGVSEEDVLARITSGVVKGLGFLKDTLQIMHRDVKPTNILVNRKGQIKLCDFGVSGQLEKSLAKTNIGCETYMAPERISGEYANSLGTYSVASDVWSLGLSIIETAIGRYPYPPEVFSSPLAQLQAIVHGEPPTLPETFSTEARDFIACCLRKEPTARPTYAELLRRPFLLADVGREVDMVGWVARNLEKRVARGAPIMPPADSGPKEGSAPVVSAPGGGPK